MIDPVLGQAAFRTGFYIAFVSGILSLLTEPSSSERVISIFTFIISLVFLVFVAVLVRWSRQREVSSDEKNRRSPEKKEVVSIEQTAEKPTRNEQIQTKQFRRVRRKNTGKTLFVGKEEKNV